MMWDLLGCLPCFCKKNNLRNVKQASGDNYLHSNAHELTAVTSIEPNALDEIENELEGITRIDEGIFNHTSKIPGTIDDVHKDEISPRLITSSSQSNLANTSSLSLSLEQERTEEDMQNAAILQAVVRAYIMRKAKLKEENTPFSELMVTAPSFSTFPILEDDISSLLIPQVPHFRSQFQQLPSTPSVAIPPPPPPQQSLFQPPTFHSPLPYSLPSHSHSMQVPILQELSPPLLPQAPLRTPNKPLLANTLRHAISSSNPDNGSLM